MFESKNLEDRIQNDLIETEFRILNSEFYRVKMLIKKLKR